MDKQNVDNLKSILSGKDVEKKVQVGYTTSNEHHSEMKGKSVGDVWESNGKKWTKNENGTITNVTRFDDIRIPLFCPKCNTAMRGKNDTKAYYSNGTCLNCMVDYHNELRKSDELEKFMWAKRLRSAQSWYNEQIVQFDEMCESYKKNPEFVMSDGTIEKWTTETDFSKIIEEYQSYLNTYKEKLDKSIEDFEQKYNDKL